MIPCAINDTGLVFFLRGRPHAVASDHPRYAAILEAVRDPATTPERIGDILDRAGAIVRRASGQIRAEGGYLYLRDSTEPLGSHWEAALLEDGNDTLLDILLARPGDRIRVVGDEDCPDGTYRVEDLDLQDANATLYVEDPEGYLGYVQNTSIQEVIHAEQA